MSTYIISIANWVHVFQDLVKKFLEHFGEIKFGRLNMKPGYKFWINFLGRLKFLYFGEISFSAKNGTFIAFS